MTSRAESSNCITQNKPFSPCSLPAKPCLVHWPASGQYPSKPFLIKIQSYPKSVPCSCSDTIQIIICHLVLATKMDNLTFITLHCVYHASAYWPNLSPLMPLHPSAYPLKPSNTDTPWLQPTLHCINSPSTALHKSLPSTTKIGTTGSWGHHHSWLLSKTHNKKYITIFSSSLCLICGFKKSPHHHSRTSN